MKGIFLLLIYLANSRGSPICDETNACCLLSDETDLKAAFHRNCKQIESNTANFTLRLGDVNKENLISNWLYNVKSIKGIYLSISRSIFESLNFRELETLNLKGLIIEKNYRLTSISMPALKRIEGNPEVLIIDNNSLEEISLPQLEDIETANFNVINNLALLKFDLSSLKRFNCAGNMIISTNRFLTKMKFNKKAELFKIQGEMKIDNNINLEAIHLPTAPSSRNTISLTRNYQLRQLIVGNYTNLTLTGSPGIMGQALIDLKRAATNPSQLQQIGGECEFYGLNKEMKDIDPCKIITSSLVFARNTLVNNKLDTQIEEVRGDLDFSNLELHALGPFFETRVYGTLKTALCNLDLSYFKRAPRKERTVPCPESFTPTTTEKTKEAMMLAYTNEEFNTFERVMIPIVATLGGIALVYTILVAIVAWRTKCLGYFEPTAVRRRDFRRRRKEAIKRVQQNTKRK